MFSIKNILIGIAIIILTAFVVIYGIQTFYPKPEFETYCNVTYGVVEIQNATQCEALNGKWNPEYGAQKPVPYAVAGYCDLEYYCRQNFDETNKIYTRNLFVIATIIGLVLLGIGVFLFELESVGAGIMGGGIVTLIYGSTQYWQYSGNAFRFTISLVGLVLVILLGYWLNRKKK